MLAAASERVTEDAGDRLLGPARRALIARRLPWFAASWIGIGVVLRTGLVLRGGLSLRLAVVSITLQIAVLAAAILWVRRSAAGIWVPRVVFATCLFLLVLSAGFFMGLGGSLEGLIFSLGAIAIGSSYAFAWGWLPAVGLAVTSGALAAFAVVATSIARFSDPIWILLEGFVGSAISITIAEASYRSFERSFREDHVRRISAERLAAAHDAYRDLAEKARDLIFTHDLGDRRFTYVNDALARFFGRSPSDMLGMSVGDVVPSDADNPDPAPLIERLLAGEEIPPQVVWVRRGEDRRWLECIMSAMHDADGRIVGVRGIARDVTERHDAEEALRASLDELRRSEERLRRLARHQASIREDERKRLGFDLHDDVCQELIGIGILLEAARRRLVAAVPEMEPELARVGRYVGEVGEHLRQLAHDLRPMLLRDLGLVESLHSLADAITVAGTPVHASFPAVLPRLGEATEIGVYRIAQEALGNAVRHAQARTIRLTLALDGGTLALEIADDGCGFSPAARFGSEALGLVGMEERALALGGRLELRSAPGEGTSVRLTCPVALRASSAA